MAAVKLLSAEESALLGFLLEAPAVDDVDAWLLDEFPLPETAVLIPNVGDFHAAHSTLQ